MTLVSYRPLRELARAQGDVARMMRNAFGDFDATHTEVGAFAPPVDIVERAETLVLTADLPGVRRESIDVSIENRTLTLTGERAVPSDADGDRALRSEREYGRFSRSFALPMNVDANAIKAEFRDGVLEIVVPKAAEARPQKIAVHCA